MANENLPTETEQLKHRGPIARENITSGGMIAGIIPQNLEDAFRLSSALARAGNMVPKDFQGQPDMIMAAIMRGAEVGLAPMQALSNIAVINGRPCLWGDAIPALIQKAGHQIDVEISGDDGKEIATATLIRGDTGQTIVRTFSMDDALKAKLLGKNSPWQTYPKRMLMMRARSWAVRDGAADALMGLAVAEEVQDYRPIKDVTPNKPQSGGFADAVNKKLESIAPVDPEPDAGEDSPETTESDQDGEPSTETQGGDSGASDGIDIECHAYKEGQEAFDAGTGLAGCPYEIGNGESVNWIAGWKSAFQEANYQD